MARAAATTDAFTAVAEPRRREVMDLLSHGERPVNDLVALLGWPQPLVSKHLRVLREVGLVDVREVGRRRLYSVNGNPLEAIYDWVKDYERTWAHRFERLDGVLEDLKGEAARIGERPIGTPVLEEAKVEEARVEESKVEVSKVEESKVEESKVDESTVDEATNQGG